MTTRTDGDPLPEPIQDIIHSNEGIEGCARCGKNHDKLDWKPLTCAVYHGGGEVDVAWAMCPELNEPILLGYRDAKSG